MELKLDQFEAIECKDLEQVNGGSLTVLGVAATVTAASAALYGVYQCGECVGKFIYNVTH